MSTVIHTYIHHVYLGYPAEISNTHLLTPNNCDLRVTDIIGRLIIVTGLAKFPEVFSTFGTDCCEMATCK